MKKLALLLALCLMLSIFAGCSSDSVSETTGPDESTSNPVETTEPSVETTEPSSPLVIEYTLDLPEGFSTTVVQENYVLYCAPFATRDSSTISVQIQERNEYILLADAEIYKQFLENMVDGTDGAPTAYRFYDLQLVEVDGWSALYTEYSLSYDEIAFRITCYQVVTTECNYIFTFADATDDNEWQDAYAAAAASIQLVQNNEQLQANRENLTRYDMDCGLTIYAEASMKEYAPQGFTACLGNHNVIILLMADDKEANNLTEMSLEEYAQLLCQTNELDAFSSDAYGNLLTTFYSVDENELEYYNMIFVKESADSFWVCQMTCLAEDQATYARIFGLWASTISV